MKICIKSIASRAQRYPTAGDWWFDARGKGLEVRVNHLGDERAEVALAVHELIEAMLCHHAGITTQDVDAWDLAFEERRARDEAMGEPGDDPQAPYHKQHVFATKIERMLVEEFGMNWLDYDTMVDASDEPLISE